MKSMDKLCYAKEAITYYHQFDTVHCQQKINETQKEDTGKS